MLGLFRYLQIIRDAKDDDGIRDVLARVAADFKFRSAVLIEYGAGQNGAQLIIDTHAERGGVWAQYFSGGTRQVDPSVWSALLEERVVQMDAGRLSGATPAMLEFLTRHDLLDTAVVPIGLDGEVIAVISFCGTTELSPSEASALLLTAYAVFAQARQNRGAAGSPRRARLTAREREVVELSAEGLTSQQIAERLGMSARTANQHIDNVMAKLGTRNRTHTIAEALRRNLMH